MANIMEMLRGGADIAGAATSGDWSGAASALGRQAIGRVEVRSQVLPTIVVDPFAPAADAPAPAGDGMAAALMSFVKPEVVILDPQGGLVAALAPYGPPQRNYFPWIVGGAVAAVIGVVASIAWAARKIGR